MFHELLIFAAGLLAGAMNALAGGGSFVSLPVLMAVGVPAIQANASSTVALFPGGVVSAWAYRDGLGPVGTASLRALLIATVAGGVIGAVLLLSTPVAGFNRLLPWLLLLATIALSFGRRLGAWMRRHWHIRPATVVAIQFLLGIYGGYFGGAVGIMMLAVWGLLDSRDLKSLNAPRTVLVSAANLMAVLTFSVAHAVYWPQTLMLLCAATIGGYAGAHIGRRAPARIVHAGTLLLTAGITVAFFVHGYWP